MPRKIEEPVERIHIMVFSSDMARLRQLFEGQGKPGISTALRVIIRQYLKRVDQFASKASEEAE